MTHWKHYLL